LPKARRGRVLWRFFVPLGRGRPPSGARSRRRPQKVQFIIITTPVSPRGRIRTEIPKFSWPWPAHWSSGSNAESAVRKASIAATTEHGERPNTQQANGVQVWHVAIGSMTQRPTTRQRAASPRPRPCVVRRRGVSWRGGTPQWVVDYNSGTDRRCGSRSARRTRGSSPTTKHTRS